MWLKWPARGRGQAGGAEVTGTGRAMGTEVWYREFLLRVREPWDHSRPRASASTAHENNARCAGRGSRGSLPGAGIWV